MEIRDFRTAQVLGDLDRGIGAGVMDDPWATAFDPDAAPCDVWGATASILYEAIVTQTADPALEVLWADQLGRFRVASPAIRAALMNGFDHLRARWLIPEACTPAPADLIIHSRESLEPALIALARRMTPAELDHVAGADYGNDTARHRAALVTLLANPRLAYPPGEHWYPAEVVELVSHVPGQPGHIPCMAIVLLDALRSGDRCGNAEYRFANQFAEIAALSPVLRDPFFAAFRYLYEANRDWDPTPSPRNGWGAGFTLPWADR